MLSKLAKPDKSKYSVWNHSWSPFFTPSIHPHLSAAYVISEGILFTSAKSKIPKLDILFFRTSKLDKTRTKPCTYYLPWMVTREGLYVSVYFNLWLYVYIYFQVYEQSTRTCTHTVNLLPLLTFEFIVYSIVIISWLKYLVQSCKCVKAHLAPLQYQLT